MGIQPLPIKPGSPTKAVPGWDVRILDIDGAPLPANRDGAVTVKLPLPPGALLTLWESDDRYVETYLSAQDGYYLTGDGGHVDADGYLFVMGRTDDVINVSGHRLSTGAIEEVLRAGCQRPAPARSCVPPCAASPTARNTPSGHHRRSRRPRRRPSLGAGAINTLLLRTSGSRLFLVSQQPWQRQRHMGIAELGDEEIVPAPLSEPVWVDGVLIEALSRGDEDAFSVLLNRYHLSLLRLARIYVSTNALAEEVVQETWLGFLGSLSRFERRCSLKTWLFVILVRCAARIMDHERRSIPFSAIWNAGTAPGEFALEPDRFFPAGHRWSGIWRLDRAETVPTGWAEVPEERLLSEELTQVIGRLVAGLPPAQREVFTLRDIEGLTTEEASRVLRVTPNNQRVLLHRARSRLRRGLEHYLRSP